MKPPEARFFVARTPPEEKECRKRKERRSWRDERAKFIAWSVLAQHEPDDARRRVLEGRAARACGSKFALELAGLHGETPWPIPEA